MVTVDFPIKNGGSFPLKMVISSGFSRGFGGFSRTFLRVLQVSSRAALQHLQRLRGAAGAELLRQRQGPQQLRRGGRRRGSWRAKTMGKWMENHLENGKSSGKGMIFEKKLEKPWENRWKSDENHWNGIAGCVHIPKCFCLASRVVREGNDEFI